MEEVVFDSKLPSSRKEEGNNVFNVQNPQRKKNITKANRQTNKQKNPNC